MYNTNLGVKFIYGLIRREIFYGI